MRNFALVFGALAFVCQAHCQWTRTGGPEGGYASAILNTGQSLLLAAGSVFRSTDEGTTWNVSDAGFTPETRGILALALKGTTVFAGTGAEGVYRSTDDGATWQPSRAGMEAETDVCRFSLNDSLLFAASEMHGVYRSTDNGATWLKVNTGLADTIVEDVLLRGTEVYAATWSSGIFKSTDKGATWVPANTGLTGDALRLLSIAGTPTAVLAGTRDGIYRSTDGGASWSKALSGLTSFDVSCLLPRGSDVFAGTLGSGVFRSTNDGVNWTSLTNGLDNYNIRGIAARGNAVYAATYGGRTVYRTTDNGSLWTAAGTGIVSSFVRAITTVGARMVAATDNGIRASTDNGDSWFASDSGAKSLTAYALLSRGSEVYMGSTSQGVFRSVDSGFTWTAASNGLVGSAARSIWSLADDGTAVYAGTMGGVYMSTTHGDTWLPAMKSGLTDTLVTALLAKPGLLLAGTRQGLFKSTDQGASWVLAPSSLPPYSANALAATASAIVVAMGANIYSTTDGGATWTPGDGIPSGSGPIRSLGTVGNTLVAGGAMGRACLSTNGGQNWTDISAGLLRPGTGVQAFTAGNGYVWAATSAAGVWKRSLSEIIVSAGERGEPAVPERIVLLQNYANPFNPTTTIGYYLPHRSLVKLTVINALGQQVACLLNGDVEAGYHSVRFNAAGLSSGIYFYRLQAGRTLLIRAMVLVK